MPSPSRSNREVIVGGGLAGLSTAMRLAQMGHAITLFERMQLGARASTRNQGWLRSGADTALDQPALSHLCHQELQATLAFCPECAVPVVQRCGGHLRQGERTGSAQVRDRERQCGSASMEPTGSTPEITERASELGDLYHCQKCGQISRRLPGLNVPTCCKAAMVKAAQTALTD